MNSLRWVKSIIVLALVPLLIFISVSFLKNQNYYLVSTLILVALLVPFEVEYKIRKPNTKKIVLLATLSAIATIGRIAFYMFPQCKPVLAIVILSAVILGPYEGFLVGALTAFVSNFYFGQGPWTVWQMFASGIIGFAAGFLFRKFKITRQRLCIFGILSTFFIYGLIMNFATIVLVSGPITKHRVLATYASGISYDLAHGISTYIFLFFIYRPFTESLTRIKLKYDIE